MQRRLLATLALLGALVGSVLLGGASPAGAAYASGDSPGTSAGVAVNRGW